MTHRRTRLVLALAAALLAPAALPGTAHAADPFWGDEDVTLGDSVRSTLTGAAGEVHLFSFYGVAGTTVVARLAADAGSGLVPGLRLLRPGGSVVETGRALRATATGAQLRAYRLPFSGWFVLEVTARSGAGAYVLTTDARPAPDQRGYARGARGEQTWRIRAAAGSRLTAVLAARRGGARLAVGGLADPDGDAVRISPVETARGVTLRDVLLTESGTYVLRWRNDGAAADVDLRFTLRQAPGTTFDRVLPASRGRPSSQIDAGAPKQDARAGYVGSHACGRCHDEEVRGWAATAHNLAVRPWDQAGLTGLAFVNDVNANGKDDFVDGLDLATQPAFAAYGANAPKLAYVAGDAYPYKITIGAVRYDVVRTMGGNGLWKQRYLVSARGHLFPSPVQWNDAQRAYVTYDPADWYDGANQPLHASADVLPRDKSFEARCSGCHNTGETLTVTAGGDYVTGYVEFNVGCEQCHGPGAEHAATGDRAKILNPRTLVDGTAEGTAQANDVCGRCHTRGDALDAFPVTGARAGFGFSATKGVPHAGDDLDDFFVPTTKVSDFWGRKTNPTGSGDTWVASKSHRQQSLDVAAGAHAPSDDGAPACFDCHDPHVRANAHQVSGRRDRDGVRVVTRQDDNSLCLSCHAGSEPFPALAASDVAGIAGGPAPAAVAAAVVRHMADRGMSVAPSLYDPAGTGVGNCVSCHMPATARSAAWGSDAAGNREGDLRSHVFRTITARASQLHKDAGVGVTNSCNACHPTRGGDPVATVLTQWAGDPDADGTFHADTPRSFQNGVANAGRDGGVRCAQCHTTEGFVRIQARGETPTQAQVDAWVRDAVAGDKGISCDACHGARPDGTFDVSTRQPLRFPKAELCGRCHNGQTVVFEDFEQRGEMIRHPQREMLDGTAGSEVPGAAPYGNTAHTGALLEDGCVTCHFDPSKSGASHSFAPQLASCKTCHPTLTSFNRAAPDYDGDGSAAEGIQGEVTGLLDRVKAALLASSPQIVFAGGSFDVAGSTDHKLTGATTAQKRAAYNWYSVNGDASRGVHNALRTVQLLQRSYEELTGAPLPGAVLR